MNYRTLFLLFLFIPSFLFADLESGFSSVTSAMIQAYYYSSNGDFDGASVAFENFESEWDDFFLSYSRYNWSDDQWRDDFEAADELAKSAVSYAQDSQTLDQAAVDLMSFQWTLRTLRERNEMLIFFDTLTRLQEPLWSLLEAAENTSGLSESEALLEIKMASSEVMSVWSEIFNAEISEDEMDLEEESLETLAAALENTETAVAGLKTAVSGGSLKDAVSSAEEIEESYLSALLALGNLSPQD